MAHVDEEIILTRAHLALEVIAIGQALLDSDYEEAAFRAHLLQSQAYELQLDGVALAALHVLDFLPRGVDTPLSGIGRAMLRLRDAIDEACR